MAEEQYDLVCIGSGPAGQRAAVQGAKLGKRIAIVENQNFVGGHCVQSGTIPSKTFREAVQRVSSTRRLDGASRDSIGSRSRLRPTMEQLVGHCDIVIDQEIDIVHDALARNDVEIVFGRASFTGPKTVQIESARGNRILHTRNTLVAVGTLPSKPQGVDHDGQTVITSDEILGLKKIPRSMVVVGAGVIGIEYASMFAALGVEVTVIDGRSRPLEFVDHEIIDELIHQMRRTNVTFRCGDAVRDIKIVTSPTQQGLVTLESGKHVVADVILFSAGRVGATEHLNLAAAGLKADERGRLVVDDSYQTSVKGIYAAGDVIGFPALAATSSEQGRLSARHMFGAPAEPMVEHFPVGIYSIPELSMVGATEEELTEAKIPYETGVARYREISRGPIVGDDSGMFKMLFHRDDERLLGCHCIGTGATELVHVGQAVLALGGGLDYFLKTVFNYPTLAECYKVAAYRASNKLAITRHATDQDRAPVAQPSMSNVAVLNV
ncbi:MAG: NAD(P) transhydrogenase [Gammaproteobacteria bacterium]|jgi:NAD(P) transhydrogenase